MNEFDLIQSYFNWKLNDASIELGVGDDAAILNYKTDKSPYNPKHRHSYTGIYHFLFHKIKNYNLNIAEIGCYKNEGMKMFREYFSDYPG